MRVGLVSCSKAKLDHAAQARDLYSKSALFRGARCHVERTCDRWFVLSAKHGLVKPEQVLEPYNQTLNDASRAQRRAWSARVLAQLHAELGDLRGITFELHAGAPYVDFGVADGLVHSGAIVEKPLEGLGLGRRLRFYKEEGCL
ncbi:MAG: DUF6884 domain-containing protein [Actinomycetota bacterium]